MRKWLAIPGIVLAASLATAADAPDPATDREKVSYAIGVDMGKSLRQQGIDVDPDILNGGLRDALSGGRLRMSDGDLRKALAMYKSEVRRKQNEARRKRATDAVSPPPAPSGYK